MPCLSASMPCMSSMHDALDRSQCLPPPITRRRQIAAKRWPNPLLSVPAPRPGAATRSRSEHVFSRYAMPSPTACSPINRV